MEPGRWGTSVVCARIVTILEIRKEKEKTAGAYIRDTRFENVPIVGFSNRIPERATTERYGKLRPGEPTRCARGVYYSWYARRFFFFRARCLPSARCYITHAVFNL